MSSARLLRIIERLGLPLATALLGGIVGSVLTYWSANREMDVKMVEIALGILAKSPTDPVKPAREWAVDVINQYSAVKLSPQARDAFLENQIEIGGMPSVEDFLRVGITPEDAKAMAEQEKQQRLRRQSLEPLGSGKTVKSQNPN
jgi:hypothetical protein